ncbi:hypothetical protein UWK_01275 [Desulfocapsa sulfexigens DSM 10523]|uniref:Carboxymuconolactone decarboxylase-like domain-containing protein n=1 Tax=Desulfocapsa sulfexigens (strain DSM 10523 / SB164P1) TaxID=1167006 RepID=M1P2X6_DESSD|nr:hypothetical protein [Desulfocapsa sulfexigens]AGF77838.1 hypothetical protein UWK_01275 [Desulfocapsa sulfexigens DSM 10523]
MFIIDAKPPENPTKKLKAMLDVFEKKFGGVPPHFKLLGTLNSDELEITLDYVIRLMQHPTINPDLFTFLRLHIAQQEGYRYCVQFNTNLLKSAGYDNDIIIKSSGDISKVPFEKKLQILAIKAVKGVLRFKEFGKRDLDELYGVGWDDNEIFDAINHCGFMLKNGRLISSYILK